jgi:hypothetical protein
MRISCGGAGNGARGGRAPPFQLFLSAVCPHTASPARSLFLSNFQAPFSAFQRFSVSAFGFMFQLFRFQHVSISVFQHLALRVSFSAFQFFSISAFSFVFQLFPSAPGYKSPVDFEP